MSRQLYSPPHRWPDFVGQIPLIVYANKHQKLSEVAGPRCVTSTSRMSSKMANSLGRSQRWTDNNESFL